MRATLLVALAALAALLPAPVAGAGECALAAVPTSVTPLAWTKNGLTPIEARFVLAPADCAVESFAIRLNGAFVPTATATVDGLYVVSALDHPRLGVGVHTVEVVPDGSDAAILAFAFALT